MLGGSFPEPRPFQVDAHEALRQGIKAGHRRQCMMAPTGAGKTYIAMRVINEALKRGRRAVFLCDRITLINQTSDVADRYGLWDHGIIQADNPRLDLSKPFQIASLQTLARRGWPEADVIVIDECHSLYRGWTDYVSSDQCKAAVVGLSATPFAKGLGKIFTNLINAATMHELTESGVLVPMRILSGQKPDLKGLEVNSRGEWNESDLAERELVLVGDLISEWQKNAENRKTICFGTTIKHCEEMTRQFNAAGIPAACFTAETKPEERAALLEDYRRPDSYLRVLVSVEALAKGFDVPDVGCICDCRPLRKSLSTAIQMWGRGLRSSPNTDKQDCILLDFSGNIVRFLDDFEHVFFNGLDRLDDGEKLDKKVREEDEREPRSCPSCGYTPMGKRCMQCGFEPVAKAMVEALPGNLQEIKLGDGRVMAPDERNLFDQLCRYALTHSQKPEGRAKNLFRSITGKWPPRSWNLDPLASVTDYPSPTAPLLSKIRALDIAWRNSRRAS